MHLELNPSLGVPLYRQIMDGIKELIATGVLAPGAQLPSIRELAAQLRINASSAVKAYGELRNEGVIDQDQGRGTFVRGDAKVVAQSREAILGRALDALITRARTLGFSDDDLAAALDARLGKRTSTGRKTG
jgi:GntR family transcriptional regulator